MNETYPPLNNVQVWTDTGETWKTSVASAIGERESVAYFMGQTFNIGIEDDCLVRVNAVMWHAGK